GPSCAPFHPLSRPPSCRLAFRRTARWGVHRRRPSGNDPREQAVVADTALCLTGDDHAVAYLYPIHLRSDLDDDANAAVCGEDRPSARSGAARLSGGGVADLPRPGAPHDVSRSDRQELELLHGRAVAESDVRSKGLARRTKVRCARTRGAARLVRLTGCGATKHAASPGQ